MDYNKKSINSDYLNNEIIYTISLMHKKYSQYINLTNFDREILVSTKNYILKLNNDVFSSENIQMFIERKFIKKIRELLSNDIEAHSIINSIVKKIFNDNDNNYSNIVYEFDKLDIFLKNLNYNPTIDLITDIINENESLQKFLNYINSKTNKNVEIYNDLLISFINGYKLINDIYDVDDLNFDYLNNTSYGDIDIFKMYLNDVQHEVLTKEEEIDLAKKIRNGDKKARNTLIEHNLLLVVSIASKYKFKGVELMDLISEGNIGLIKAVKNFDPSKGYRFSTYATWWIRNYVLSCINNQSQIIRVPKYNSYILIKYENARNKLLSIFNREPNIDEIANEIGMQTTNLINLLSVVNTPLSLDCSPLEDSDTKFEEIVTDGISVDDIILEKEMKSEIYEVLSTKLDPREFSIIVLRYGLLDGRRRSLNEIGIKLNLTRERIRQIEKNALRKLRHQKTLTK